MPECPLHPGQERRFIRAGGTFSRRGVEKRYCRAISNGGKFLLRNYFALRACFLSTFQKLRSGILISYQAIAIARQACACGHKIQRIGSQSGSPTGKRCEYTVHKGVKQAVVTPAAISITATPTWHSCRGRTVHTGSRAPISTAYGRRSRAVSACPANEAVPTPSGSSVC